MKIRFLATMLLVASFAIISCSKDKDAQPQNSLVLKMRQGIIPGDDTVYIINYDANNRITSIVDSVYEDTIKIEYNDAGRLSDVKDLYFPAAFTYNEAGLLTEAFYEAGENSERCVFEYTNGVLSKKSEYHRTNANSPALNLWKYYTYVVTNGNITNRKEYDAADGLLSETNYTYSTHPNAFKSLALLNTRNTLGLGDLGNHETYFNSNLMATSSVGGEQTTFSYAYISNERLANFIVTTPYAVYTRMFSY